MKTDPISAAVGYRQALQRALQAKTHHEARKIIAQALEITFDPPTEGHISISSGWGANTQQVYVTMAAERCPACGGDHVTTAYGWCACWRCSHVWRGV